MAKGEIIQFPRRDEESRFHLADGELPSSSHGPPLGGLGSFDLLGEVTLPVILRLRGKFPRIKVARTAGEEPPSS